MASIVFKCSACSRSIASDDSLCGEMTTCPECGADVLVPIPGLEPGATCGDFKLIERLGAGAMGEVWLAEQTSMERKVALKVLFPQLASDKRFVARFLKEAKNSAKLAHPNIVTAFHAGVDRGIYYLAISFVSGETIESILDSGRVYEEKEALRIIRDIASALEYAWDEFKILHRDIKPANIIINKKGVPMLLDMGISKSLDEDSSLTMTGTVVGTPYYMSPEQAIASEDVDFRSDIYSLGTTLYHMLTGSVPFQAGTAMAIIMRHLHDELPPPRERNSDITENCEKLLHCMMAKKREHRPQSWKALRDDLTAVMNGKPPITKVPEPDAAEAEKGARNLASKKGGVAQKTDPEKTGGMSKAKLLLVGAALLTALLGTAAAGYLTYTYLLSDGNNASSASSTANETARPSSENIYGPPPPSDKNSSTSPRRSPDGSEKSDLSKKTSDSASTSVKGAEAAKDPSSTTTTTPDGTPLPTAYALASTEDSPQQNKDSSATPNSTATPRGERTTTAASATSINMASTPTAIATAVSDDNTEIPWGTPKASAKDPKSKPAESAGSSQPASPSNAASKTKNQSTNLDASPSKTPAKSSDPTDKTPISPSASSTASPESTAGNDNGQSGSTTASQEVSKSRQTSTAPGATDDDDGRYEEDFVKFSENLDLTKNTKLYARDFWKKNAGTEHIWRGKVAYVKGGWWKAEVRVACPGRPLYKGFNVVLVTSDKAKASKFKIGQTITFKGSLYSYKHKWNGLVILYLKNVKFIDVGSNSTKP